MSFCFQRDWNACHFAFIAIFVQNFSSGAQIVNEAKVLRAKLLPCSVNSIVEVLYFSDRK